MPPDNWASCMCLQAGLNNGCVFNFFCPILLQCVCVFTQLSDFGVYVEVILVFVSVCMMK